MAATHTFGTGATLDGVSPRAPTSGDAMFGITGAGNPVALTIPVGSGVTLPAGVTALGTAAGQPISAFDAAGAATAATAGLAPLASPGFSGTPTAPTAVPGANSTQLATTAFATAAVAAEAARAQTAEGNAVQKSAVPVAAALLASGTGGALLPVTLGTNLSISGGTLNATGGSGGTTYTAGAGIAISGSTIATSGVALAGNNLSDLTAPATARTNLGLGTAATQASTAFDAAGAASAAVATETARAQAAEAAAVQKSGVPLGLLVGGAGGSLAPATIGANLSFAGGVLSASTTPVGSLPTRAVTPAVIVRVDDAAGTFRTTPQGLVTGALNPVILGLISSAGGAYGPYVGANPVLTVHDVVFSANGSISVPNNWFAATNQVVRVIIRPFGAPTVTPPAATASFVWATGTAPTIPSNAVSQIDFNSVDGATVVGTFTVISASGQVPLQAAGTGSSIGSVTYTAGATTASVAFGASWAALSYNALVSTDGGAINYNSNFNSSPGTITGLAAGHLYVIYLVANGGAGVPSSGKSAPLWLQT